MYISHIKLINWKNFVGVDVDLQKRMFVVGPNASGKSNFLDAFRFLHDIAKQGGGLQKAITDRGGLSKIRCLAARQNPNVTLDVTLSDDDRSWRYLLSIKQDQRAHHKHFVNEEIVWINQKKVLQRPEPEDLEDKDLLTQTHLEQIRANKDFRQLADFFSETMYFHLVPQLVKNPQAFTGPTMPEDPFGRKFLEKVAKTNKIHRSSWLKRIAKALKIAVPQLEDLNYQMGETGVPHLQATYSHWRARGAKQNEKEFSDGTLRLIALFWSLLEGKHLLLLEEPELSLHTSIVSQLAEIIYQLQKDKDRQVMISTHSYELLDNKGIGLDEILLLNPDAAKEETIVQPASSAKDARILLKSSFSPAEIVISRTKPKKISKLQLAFGF